MWGMRHAIDVALTDARGRVVALYPGLAPWRRTRIHRDAARAVELPEGMLERTGTRPGDRIEIHPPPGEGRVPSPGGHAR